MYITHNIVSYLIRFDTPMSVWKIHTCMNVTLMNQNQTLTRNFFCADRVDFTCFIFGTERKSWTVRCCVDWTESDTTNYSHNQKLMH